MCLQISLCFMGSQLDQILASSVHHCVWRSFLGSFNAVWWILARSTSLTSFQTPAASSSEERALLDHREDRVPAYCERELASELLQAPQQSTNRKKDSRMTQEKVKDVWLENILRKALGRAKVLQNRSCMKLPLARGFSKGCWFVVQLPSRFEKRQVRAVLARQLTFLQRCCSNTAMEWL